MSATQGQETPREPPGRRAAAHHFGWDGRGAWPVFDAAVVMPTLMRPTIARALRSVFQQRFDGRVHILIGVDRTDADRRILDTLGRELPRGVVMTVLDPGYSTARVHGGLHAAHDGGALRTVLSYLANSRHVAYLDDDNWWRPDHLARLRRAIEGADWAYSLRWFVEEGSGRPLCVDRWESLGPGRGVFARELGGWVDPNCLMIDKIACEPVLARWSVPLAEKPVFLPADRHVFDLLRTGYRPGATGEASCYYTIRRADALHPRRLAWIEGEKAGSQPRSL